MRRIGILGILLLISVVSAGIQITVSISGVIDGNIAYLDVPNLVNNTPQKFLLDWENLGSVACRVRARVDVYNKSELIYTAWSKEVPMEPGYHSSLEAYFYPTTSGNYTAKISVYYCNLMEEKTNVNFTVIIAEKNVTNKTISKAEIPLEIKTRSTEDYVEMRIRAKENISNLLVIPRDYPLGWIFPSERIDINAGEEKVVRIKYIPSIWKKANVSFDIATMDGRIHTISHIVLSKGKKTYSIEHITIVVLIVIIIFLTFLLIKERKKEDGYREMS